MAFHAFEFTEFYSNASGTIQFIELRNTGGTGEHFWNGTVFQVTQTGTGTVHTFTVPSNLEPPTAFDDRVLLATQAFADLDIVTPDFIIPDGFLFLDGGTIVFRNASGSLVADTDIYGALPTDHEHSINDNDVEQSNSPMNFAGDTGHISNNAPGLNTLLLDKVAGSGQAFSYKFAAGTFTDADGDSLAYSATLGNGAALPAWLSFSGATRMFSGTPAPTDAGMISVKVTASDGNGGTTFDKFVINVISGMVIPGTSGDDMLPGDANADSILGMAGNDTLTGAGDKDTLVGAGGNDVLSGGGGMDLLIGGTGADKLTGGGGSDFFRFAETGSGNVAKDFEGGMDRLQLDHVFFEALGSTPGLVDPSMVQSGLASEINDTSGDGDFLKYATDTGRLYYDADGGGAGALQLIATVHTKVGATDFSPTTDVFVI